MGHPWRNREQRFWASAKHDLATGCWLWTKGRSSGYGKIQWKGKHTRAHVVAALLSGLPVGPGVAVCHTCDVKLCINPAHLFVGTHQDNDADKIAKRRHAFGERFPQARLTARAVLEMRQRWSGGERISALAKEYGVGRSTASVAIRGLRWRLATEIQQ